MKLVRLILIVVLAWSVIKPVNADPVSLPLDKGLVVEAEYRPAQAGKPTALLLHGFLQTREFPTIHRLIEGLASAGYGVLAPTLSLGISWRKQSLACEAVHSHTLADDRREIGAWVNWLQTRSGSPVVLVGHSTGSMELLAWLDIDRPAGIRKFIGISLVEARLESSPADRNRLLRELAGKFGRGDRALIRQQISFCRNYLGSPASLHSYLEWSPERMLRAARRIKTPQAYIMGGRDDRLGPGWLDMLRNSGQRVRVIDGADHFMDGEHEFDLLDYVLEEVARP